MMGLVGRVGKEKIGKVTQAQDAKSQKLKQLP